MKSVSSIAKLTAAMKFISTIGLRRHQNKLASATIYHQHLLDILEITAQSIEEKPLLINQTGDKPITKPAIVAIFSDKGLCGAYNHLIASRTSYLMHHTTDAQLFILGHKGLSALQEYEPHFKEHHTIKAMNTYTNTKALAQHLIAAFYAGDIHSCIVVHTHFKSILSTKAEEKTLFPISLPAPTSRKLLYGTEPQGVKILKAIAEQYVFAQLHYLVQQSIVSENAVRMFSMDSATQNAENMLKTLHKEYHKTRQQNITQEIIEIMGGAEAL